DLWDVRAVRHDNHAACVPSFEGMHSVDYRYNISFSELRTRQTAEFRDNHAYVPHAVPWHMREAPPPAGLREGSWMVNLAIDRLNDHCRFANVRHMWVLPRRLRLEKAFKVEWQDERPQSFGDRVTRVSRQGYLALPKSNEQRSVTITIPDDIDAFRIGLCTDFEWIPFERSKESPSRPAALRLRGAVGQGTIPHGGSWALRNPPRRVRCPHERILARCSDKPWRSSRAHLDAVKKKI